MPSLSLLNRLNGVTLFGSGLLKAELTQNLSPASDSPPGTMILTISRQRILQTLPKLPARGSIEKPPDSPSRRFLQRRPVKSFWENASSISN